MTGAATRELVVLPPIADDPIFAEELYGESSPDLEVLTEAAAELPTMRGSDPHDFAALFMRHRWSFALHARRFLNDERDVDEVVQEGFLRLFLAMPELETELQALAYCRRTITNLCIDRYRADQRRPRLLDLEALSDEVLSDDDDVDPIVQAEDAAIVRQALAMLSPIHREALIKREVEEKSLPQIAAELDITVEQTKHLLFRARRSLRRLLVGTHVEPGVDLDLATVLAANRERAARAAKPAGAAMMSLLLLLASVLGLRSLGDRPTSMAVPPPAGALGSLLGTLTVPRPAKPLAVPGAPVAPVDTTTTTAITTVATPARPATPRRTSSGRVAPSAVPVTPSQPDSGAPGTVTPPSAVVPPVTSPPVTTPPVVAHAFVVSGVGGSGEAAVSDQQRALRAAGTTSSSTISAPTETGTYTLQQAFTFGHDGALVGIEVAETVPTALGAVMETALQGSTTTSEVAADGTIHLVTSGTSTPLEPGASLDQTRIVTLDLVLDVDRVRVLSERVEVEGGAPASPPTAPQPTVGQGAALLYGAQVPARRSDAVVDQQLTTR